MNPPAAPNAARALRVCMVTRDISTTRGLAARDLRALVDDGTDVHELRVASTSPAAFRLTVLHIKHRYDVIQVDNPPDTLALAALIPRLMGSRVVLRMREPVPERIASGPRKWSRPLRVASARWARRAALAIAHRTIVAHREVREACRRDGGDVNRITVVAQVPDDERLRPEHYDARADEIARARKEERRRGGFRVACWCGAAGDASSRDAMGYAAGLGTVVRAVERLRADVPGVSVRVIGGGDATHAALALAGELGVSKHVGVVGDVPLESAALELLGADVVVEPAGRTPYSNVVAPDGVFVCALLHRPVVAPRLASIASYFSDNAVVFFRAGDADDLAGKLHDVFTHPEDAPARVAAAVKVAQTHHWERERKKYVGAIRPLSG